MTVRCAPAPAFFFSLRTLQQTFHFHRVTCSVVVTRLVSCHHCWSPFSAEQTEVPTCAAPQGNVALSSSRSPQRKKGKSFVSACGLLRVLLIAFQVSSHPAVRDALCVRK